MEQLNLGDAIAQLKVLRLQYFDEITPEEKGSVCQYWHGFRILSS